MGCALAAMTALAGTLGASPASPVTVAEVLARYTSRDASVQSYTVPVHIDVRVHKLLTFHFGLDGTQSFKRPAHLSLDVQRVPPEGRKLFAELGTPLTWSQQYDLRLVSGSTERGAYRLEGVPKRPSGIARMVVDVDGDPSAPLHAQWWTHDGSTIDMRITEDGSGGYELPKHSEADLNISGTKIHASIDYGTYAVNEAIAEAKLSPN
ncbi:MAG TPA: hypothetical protein VK665_15885 [Candidatus Elarobacter sp.]|nr:hypothetical protein [Candidatus Elarobacter sp.]